MSIKKGRAKTHKELVGAVLNRRDAAHHSRAECRLVLNRRATRRTQMDLNKTVN